MPKNVVQPLRSGQPERREMEEPAVVVSDASPYSFTPRQIGLQQVPGSVGDIVTAMGGTASS